MWLDARFAVHIHDVPDEPRRTFGEGHAALASVMQFWGLPTTRDQIAESVRFGRLGFGSEDALMAYAEDAGLWTFASYGSVQLLRERLEHGIPVIVGLEGTKDAWGKRWYAVVVAYDASTGRILCHTGTGKPVIYSIAEFESKWRTLRRWMLVVCPPERPTWRMNVMELCTRAAWYEKKGRVDAAIRDYNAALALAPDEPLVLNALGQTFHRAGRRAEAEASYRRALDLNPDDGKVANNLAFLLSEGTGQFDEAIQLALHATRIEPGNPLALDTLGYAYLRAGRYADALATLEDAHAQALGLAPDLRAEIAMRMAQAAVKLGQTTKARQMLADAIAIKPDSVVPPELRGLLAPPALAAP